MSRFKVDHQPGYVLHTRAYRESSLLVDIFTREYGRLTVQAKGYRAPRKRQSQGLLLGFRPLLFGWSGRGELPILTAVEQHGRAPVFGALQTNCGFYANELLLKLLHRHDSHETLFVRYHALMQGLGQGDAPARRLRYFEKHLLKEIGFGLVLDHDVVTGEPITAEYCYRYIAEKGPVRAECEQPDTLSGAALIALEQENLGDEAHHRQAHQLIRNTLERHLGGRELKTRRIMREMQRFRTT